MNWKRKEIMEKFIHKNDIISLKEKYFIPKHLLYKEILEKNDPEFH